MTSLFKQAMVLGIQHELTRNNIVQYPSKQAAEAAADAVAGGDVAQAMPETSGEGGHDPAQVQMLAQQLIQLGNQMMAEAKGGPSGAAALSVPEGSSPDAEAGSLGKSASDHSPEAVAPYVAWSLMQKAAAETSAGQKAEIAKPGNKNTLSNAAQTDGTAAIDNKARPEGTHVVGVGNTNMDTSGGEVGKVTDHPDKPTTSPAGGNSVTPKAAGLDPQFAAKVAAAMAAGRKAEIAKPANKNTLPAAAATDGIAAIDLKNRPVGFAVVGQGNANFKEPQAARVGLEMPHPQAPTTGAPGSNSVIEASKAAADQALVLLYNKTAAEVGPYLPQNFNEAAKIASVRAMIGMGDDARAAFLAKLAGVKTAGELAEILGMGSGSHEEESEKDESGKPKKKEGEGEKAKEAQTNDLLARVNAASRQPV
jgi:hypothetical protein